MGKRGRPRHPDILTPREWEVLGLLREGLTNEQIAERLGVSFATARYHVSEILSKLGVSSREQAAAWRPEAERREWWRLAWPLTAAKAAGVALAAALLLGLGVLAWTVVGSEGRAGGDLQWPRTADSPASTDPPGRILFAFRDRIYSMNADGSDVVPLTPEPEDGWGTFGGGRWSPEGDWVLYRSTKGGLGVSGSWYIMRPDGSGVVELGGFGFTDVVPPCGRSAAGHWSPDETMVAFDSQFRHGVQVFTVPEGEPVITQGGAYPSWSPDATRLAFSGPARRPSAAGAGCAVHILNFATGDVEDIAYGQAPSWSPDGSQIAFSREGALYVMNADGSDERLLFDRARLPAVVRRLWRYSWYPSAFGEWSPDGRRFVYSLANELVLIDVEAGDIRSIGAGQNPRWSPDGNWLVYSVRVTSPDATPAPDGSQPEHDVMYITRSDGSGSPIRLRPGVPTDWGPAP